MLKGHFIVDSLDFFYPYLDSIDAVDYAVGSYLDLDLWCNLSGLKDEKFSKYIDDEPSLPLQRL